MPPKGKGKGKKGKGKKEDKEKLTQVDRTFYELQITDLNNKLARLRAYVAKTEETNEEVEEKLRQLHEDRTDVTAYLDRTLKEKLETIRELDERLTELSKLRDAENQQFTEKIKEWEAKYKSMHDQLTSEIKLLNGKLNSLEEFRVQRDRLLSKFDEQEEKQKESEKKHKDAIMAMEQRAIVEKDALKKDVEQKLLQLSEDFTRSSEIRNAGYTRRLIRENIALAKEISSLITAQIRMMAEHTEMKKKAKQLKDEHAENELMKKHLILTCQNKIEIIEKLSASYESLKVKFINLQKYRKLYENSIKRDICERFSYNDLANKLKILKKRVDTLKTEKTRLIGMHKQHETEIINLREVIGSIRATVQIAIDDNKPIEGMARKNLLCELIMILARYSGAPAGTQSVETMSSDISTYRPGKMGFLQRSASDLFDIFKREARKIASAERISPEFKQKQMDGKVIPKARSVEKNIIQDIEYGSTYYMSSEAEEAFPDAEEEKAVEDEEGGSYGSSSTEAGSSLGRSQHSLQRMSVLPEPTPPAPEPAAPIRASMKSLEIPDEPAPVASVEGMGEEEDENYEGEDDGEEDSINLFY